MAPQRCEESGNNSHHSHNLLVVMYHFETAKVVKTCNMANFHYLWRIDCLVVPAVSVLLIAGEQFVDEGSDIPYGNVAILGNIGVQLIEGLRSTA